MNTSKVNWPGGRAHRLETILQGEFQISDAPDLVLATVLGSCIAVCLYDPDRKIGGMNHYLLPDAGDGDSSSLRYGAHSMELLINGLIRKGAARSRLTAKVFGGARMTQNFSDIGRRNGEFAIGFLESEGFEIAARDLHGNNARRVNFHPTTGQARVNSVASDIVAPEVAPAKAPPQRSEEAITLF